MLLSNKKVIPFPSEALAHGEKWQGRDGRMHGGVKLGDPENAGESCNEGDRGGRCVGRMLIAASNMPAPRVANFVYTPI